VALWDCNPSLDQWNPAYSVASTLALLASFLLDPELMYSTRRVSPLTNECSRGCAESSLQKIWSLVVSDLGSWLLEAGRSALQVRTGPTLCCAARGWRLLSASLP
jgi:hypothetical protein